MAAGKLVRLPGATRSPCALTKATCLSPHLFVPQARYQELEVKKDGMKFIVSTRTVSLWLVVILTPKGCCVVNRGFCVANRGCLGVQYQSGLAHSTPFQSPRPALSSC